jgi:alkylation response protein AidB-like acyl-CoA dehydrogenase
MDYELSQEQQSIKDAARDFFSKRADLRAVRKAVEAGYDPEVWAAIQQLGWTGMALPEEFGGEGLGFVELAVVMEEAGYACLPAPFFSNTAAGIMLAHAGDDAQRRQWLPGIASGDARGAVGTISTDGSAIVADADDARVLVLVDGDRAALVARADAELEPVKAMDITRPYFRVRAAQTTPLNGDVAGALERVEIALSAELVGVAQRGLDMAVAYAQHRTQFGRPIGAYQAVSHRCAEMLLAVESARSATYYAAWTVAGEPQRLPLAASVAKVSAGKAGWDVTAASLQVHGGIGFTWEHDLHFFLKRAAAGARLFGSVEAHRERVASLSGLGSLTPELAAV